MINQLAEDFQEQFECLGENTEKYIILSVSKKKAWFTKILACGL